MKIKCLLLLFLLVVFTNNLYSQDYLDVSRNSEEQRELDEFGEKLVKIALKNHPDLLIADRNTEISKKQETIAKYEWLGSISVGGNINETSINPPPDDVGQNIYYPRYNFGMNIPLFLFLNQPNQSRIAKEQILISIEEKRKIELELRKSVLIAYNNYLLRKDLYEMQVQRLDEEQAILKSNESKFSNGEISFEAYNNANRKYKDDFETLLFYRTNLANAKLEIEELIGTKLEDVR